MQPPEHSGNSLHRALESKGWCRENEWLYPPRKTFSLGGTAERTPPPGMLMNLHARMKQSLEVVSRNKPDHLSERQHLDRISDMESLVETLEELLKGSGADKPAIQQRQAPDPS